MRTRPAAVLFATLLLLAATAATADDGSEVIAQAYGRNETLSTYTFHMNVAMAMRHFPWLHFNLSGDGIYNRNGSYVVHFTKMPFFASGFKQLELTPLDPTTWSKHYTVSVVGQKGELTTFALHPLGAKTEASADKTLVTMDPKVGERSVDMRYGDGGHVYLTLNNTMTSGYRLPTSGEATVDAPHMSLSAHAEFLDYNILPVEPSSSTASR